MEPQRPAPRVDSTEVTREEIAHIEQLLELIHRNNTCLVGVSQWLLVWECIQLLSVRFAKGATLGDCGKAYNVLLRCAILIGERLMERAQRLEITETQFKLATNCDQKSVIACIEFLKDQLTVWFEPGIQDSDAQNIWNEFSREPGTSLQVSA